jgi:hypothetical protein
MAAGLGYKEFTTGDVLTAADANGYLASQVVMVFASAAARTSAIASPQEGMISYLKDTNATEYYSGSAWAAIGGGGGGMTLLSTTTLTGSSTSVSITPTGYNKIEVIVYGVTNGSNGNLFMGINTDTTASNYVQAWYGTGGTTYFSGANVGVAGVNAILPGNNGYLGSNSSNIAQFTIYEPNLTTRKLVTASSAFLSDSSTNAASNSTCDYVTTSALSSIQLKTTVGSFTAGTVLVYGVK